MSRQKKQKFVTKNEEEEGLAPLRPLNPRQDQYMTSIGMNDMTIGLGPAGTGKTFIPSVYAADLYRLGVIKRIILSRPNVASGRSLGFFPGSLAEKMEPWVVPFTSQIERRLGKGEFECAMKKGNIEIVPFEVMRGRTFDDAFIILDEAQNTTYPEMRMFLTRIGENSRVVINGDTSQSDLRYDSGLLRIISMIDRWDIPCGVVEFTINDVVRSDLCAAWVRAFYQEERLSTN